MKVSFFSHCKDNSPDLREVAWGDFARCMASPQYFPGGKGDLPAISPTEFNGKRGKDFATQVHFGAVDVDYASPETLAKHIETIRNNGWSAVIYHTWNSRTAWKEQGKFKYRIMVCLSRPVLAEEWKAWVARWKETWPGCDESVVGDIARVYFVNCLPDGTPLEAQFESKVFEGSPLDVDAFLGGPAPSQGASDTTFVDTGAPIKYEMRDLKKLLGPWKRRTGKGADAVQRVVPVLEAVVNGDSIAGTQKYISLRNLCFHLMAPYGLLDADLDALVPLFGDCLQVTHKEDPFVEWPDIKKLLESGRKELKAAALLGFQHGDDVEVSQRLLKDLEKQHGQVVAVEGSLWAPDEHKRWVELPANDVSVRIMSYSGLAIGTKGQQLMVFSHRIKGIRETALSLAAQNSWFADAPAGLAFKDTFVRITPDGLVEEPLTLNHRARHGYDFVLSKEDCPVWTSFLHETYEGDAEKIALLQEFFGAALVGIATKYERALLLVGTGRDGKSTVLSVLQGMFRKEDCCGTPPASWSSDQGRAQLVGKLLNCEHDISPSLIKDADYFKTMVSGQNIDAKIVYRPVFTFSPRAAHAFSCNALPATADHSEGFYRRWLVIKHPKQVPQEAVITDLAARILTAELPAIISWALTGAERLFRNGKYTESSSLQEAIEDYQSGDPVRGFLDERADRSTEYTKGSHVYESYKDWSRTNGHGTYSNVQFGRRLSALGVKKKKSHGHTFWQLSLKAVH